MVDRCYAPSCAPLCARHGQGTIYEDRKSPCLLTVAVRVRTLGQRDLTSTACALATLPYSCEKSSRREKSRHNSSSASQLIHVQHRNGFRTVQWRAASRAIALYLLGICPAGRSHLRWRAHASRHAEVSHADGWSHKNCKFGTMRAVLMQGALL